MYKNSAARRVWADYKLPYVSPEMEFIHIYTDLVEAYLLVFGAR